MYQLTQCCRVCLHMECTLTHTSAADRDNIRFIDKLSACISDVDWQKEGFPLLICSVCIDKLRTAYDFRILCLRSETTLLRYINRQHEEAKQCISDRPLATPTKFDFGIQSEPINSLSNINNETHNSDYLSLRNLLDGSDDLGRNQYNTQNKDMSTLTSLQVPMSNMPVVSLPLPLTTDLITTKTTEISEAQVPTSTAATTPATENSKQRSGSLKITISTETQTPYALMTQSNDPILQTKVTPKRYPCNICNKDYSNYSNLRSHKKSHSGEKPFECRYCDKRFLHPHHLREHIRRHTGEKPFACSLCNKRFTIRGEVTMHMRSHTGEKPYACTFCDKKCSTHSDLKVHTRTHTGEKPFDCVICGKKFASAYILNAHNKTHTGEKPYNCNICGKRFAQSSQLTVHFRTHTGEKPYGCKHCDQRFTRNTELTIHMREHTGKVPYSCSICNRGFVYQSHYQAHMVKHSGEKPYKCVTCDKKFTTASYLQEHTRKHTGQKLFSCMHCDKTFTRAAFLQKHIRKHTGEKPYPCGICNKRFSSSNYLSTHMKKHAAPQPSIMNNSNMQSTIMQ